MSGRVDRACVSESSRLVVDIREPNKLKDSSIGQQFTLNTPSSDYSAAVVGREQNEGITKVTIAYRSYGVVMTSTINFENEGGANYTTPLRVTDNFTTNEYLARINGTPLPQRDIHRGRRLSGFRETGDTK